MAALFYLLEFFMKILFPALFVSMAPALACDPIAAIREYYVGPEMHSFQISRPVNGVYSLQWSEDYGVKCSGAKARVGNTCEVEVVQAAFCEAL